MIFEKGDVAEILTNFRSFTPAPHTEAEQLEEVPFGHSQNGGETTTVVFFRVDACSGSRHRTGRNIR